MNSGNSWYVFSSFAQSYLATLYVSSVQFDATISILEIAIDIGTSSFIHPLSFIGATVASLGTMFRFQKSLVEYNVSCERFFFILFRTLVSSSLRLLYCCSCCRKKRAVISDASDGEGSHNPFLNLRERRRERRRRLGFANETRGCICSSPTA